MKIKRKVYPLKKPYKTLILEPKTGKTKKALIIARAWYDNGIEKWSREIAFLEDEKRTIEVY